jgi:peptidoglycan LD-endopeptidase CwlK
MKTLLSILVAMMAVLPTEFSVNAGEVPPKAMLFLRAYPGFFVGYKDNLLVCKDGSTLTFDDGRTKSYEQLLSEADPEDELHQSYPTGPASYAPPALNFDPGRFRCAALFKKMYGADASAVESHLTSVVWLPHFTHSFVRITKINGVDRRLAAVSSELEQLPPEERKYVLKTGGTFNWRPIAGSDQLSAHSFGIAIDIDPE